MALTLWDQFDWDPFAEIRRLQSDMNRLFEDTGFARTTTQDFPTVNLYLSEGSVIVTAELPGLTSGDINLSIAEDTLTIRGENRPAANDNDVSWYRRERPVGAFARTVELPFRVDPDRVQAHFTDGILEIEIERPKADLPRRIEVKTN